MPSATAAPSASCSATDLPRQALDMNSMSGRFGNRRGVALPVALIGLVVVSLLVTSALLTGATEAAISGAQVSSTRSLYDAEGGLQEYLSDVAAEVDNFDPGIRTVTLAENDQEVRLTVSTMYSEVYAAGDSARRTISILAEPQRQERSSGRAVLAMVRQLGLITNMNLDVNEGAVVGSSLEVGGNSKVIDRSTLCSDTTGGGAVKHAEGASVTSRGSGEISGAVRRAETSGEDFMREVLGGYSVRDLAEYADIKFGTVFGEDPFPTNAKPSWNNSDPKLRWGCPTSMGFNCPNPADTLLFPIVAIDAGGGVIDLQGEHGQGILMVVNGHLQITGNFRFKGVLMVEGYIDMSGTGGTTGAKIEGSVLAFGLNTDQRSRVSESETQGNAVIAYNRCAVEEAQEAFNERSRLKPAYQGGSTTFSWYEVVR